MTATTPKVLELYRERHVIKPVVEWNDEGMGRWSVTVCEHDTISVHPVKGGWRHDRSEIRYFAALERGEVPVVAW